ncbi:MAG TPA: hypothetical protein PK351_07500 [Spirochaetota bacterium]|nr:hypothetical protein [Spirochaetota bacterium]HPP04658.1 hypothetical protein [Spirochaetota bacterium]
MDNKRVFQIDQECFIIYAEDLSSPKERFLRIGNSPFLKEFGEGLTFLTLLTPLYPGNPFREKEIFRPGIDRRIIGLKSYVDDFVNFLKNSNIDISRVKVSYAEYGETKNKKVTEKDFIKNLKSNKKKHSFASFYLDGNIRIFNKDELFFDLKESLKKSFDERKELEILSNFFLNYYKNIYEKSGIIHSNKSLFIFSKNNIACLTDTVEWIKDAIRVGIDPERIDFLYLTENIEPDSLWIKAFLKKWGNKKKIKLVLRENNPNWLNLLSNDIVIPVYPEKDSIKIDIGDIKLFFQNKRGYILYKNFKFKFEAEKDFLNKDRTIDAEFLLHNRKVEFKISIDSIQNNSLTLYSFNPLIFDDIEENNETIKNFFAPIIKEIPIKIKNQIFNNDSEYSSDYFPPFEWDNSFYTKLFLDTVRRAKYENKDLSKFTLDRIRNSLKSFNGSEINNNQFIIEQNLYFCKKEGIVKIYYTLLSKNMIEINENPFTIFQKEKDIDQWNSLFFDFNSKIDKIYDRNNPDVQLIKNRFEEIKRLKEFFLQERKELMEFINIMETEEKLKMEKDSKIREEKLKTLLETKEKILNKNFQKQEEIKVKEENKYDDKSNLKEESIDFNKELNDDFNAKEILLEKSNKKYNFNKYSNTINLSKILFIALFVIMGISLAIMTIFFIIYYPKINEYFKTKPQKDYFNKMKEKFDEKKDKPNKVSYYYRFYMTVVDNLHLTNLIAVSNGYHRIAYPFEKKYLTGKDPDWIYPGNILIMPDKTKIVVKDGDTMWSICENYLINEINKHEIEVRNLIEGTKTSKITIDEAKKRFKEIKEESHSEMVRDFMDKLLTEKDYTGWEPEPEKK